MEEWILENPSSNHDISSCNVFYHPSHSTLLEGDLMQYIQAAKHFDGRNGQQVKYLIMHGTAGGVSAQAVATNVFANPNAQASAHYVIGQDGTVVQCVSLSDAAWAEGPYSDGHDAFWDKYINAGINLNDVCIEIEHCKPHTDNSDLLTPAQQLASFQLAD